MIFDANNFDVWNEEEDQPRLLLIGRALLASTVRVEVYLGEDEYQYVYFVAPEVDPYWLFACVVEPGRDVAISLGTWIEHLFPGVPVPGIEVTYSPTGTP